MSDPLSWSEKVFLTFDIDWACDAVLTDVIDFVEAAQVQVTWFVTHLTPLLSRLRANPNFELGIHPNFNFLLTGQTKCGIDAKDVCKRLLDIVPEAKSVRSHFMTQNSDFLELFARMGLTHDCNHYVPEQSEIELRPWILWNGLVKVPHFWEDDLALLYAKNTPVQALKSRKGLKVFDFHPIHVFLNTENLKRYDQSRPHLGNVAELIMHRNPGQGTRTALEKLLGRMQ